VSVIEAENLVEHLHVDEVPSVLFEWNRVLCPGGYLHILTDDFERIAHTFGQVRRLRTLKQMDLFKQVTYFVLDPSFTPSSLGHKSLWTKALAKRFLESEGFEVEQMHNTGYRNWKLFVTAVKSVSKLRARGRKSSRNSL
jgi:predicted SAM-dependent methyltransferase